jgi:hypothetical protein
LGLQTGSKHTSGLLHLQVVKMCWACVRSNLQVNAAFVLHELQCLLASLLLLLLLLP